MDWTIVASVLVALLLWPVVLASLGALMFLTIATVFRARLRRLMDGPMAHCKQMFDSRGSTNAAGPGAPEPCPCAGTSESA